MAIPIRFSPRALLIPTLHILALGLWGLHWYVRAFPPTLPSIPGPDSPETRWWGLWPATYLPAWGMIIGSTLLLLCLLVAWRISMSPQSEKDGSRPDPRWIWGVSTLFVAAFYLFPIVHTRWGDAYILTRGLAWPDPALRLTHSWQAPLDVWLHSQVWHWGAPHFGWESAQPVYRLLSPLAGGIYLVTLSTLSLRWTAAPAWLTYGLLVSLGGMQLFFGYVENYSFAAAGVLLYLGLGLAVLQNRMPVWVAATALAITHALHPSTIALAPSLLFLGWTQWRTRTNQTQKGPSFGRILLQIGVPMLLVAGAVLLFMELGGHGFRLLLTEDRPGGGDGRWLVPLWETTTRWEHYTLFSWAHLRDFLNQQLLVGPIILPTLTLIGLAQIWPERGQHRSISENSVHPQAAQEHRFLAIAAGGLLLLTWLWNPDYGGQRDWDLFSLASIPLALLLASQLPRILTRRQLAVGLMPLLIVQAMHLFAWIYQNTLPWEWP